MHEEEKASTPYVTEMDNLDIRSMFVQEDTVLL